MKLRRKRVIVRAMAVLLFAVSIAGCSGRSVGSDVDIESFDLWVSCYLSEERGIDSVRLIGRRTKGFIGADDVELTRAEIKEVLEGFVMSKHFKRERQAREPLRFPGCTIHVKWESLVAYGSVEYENHLPLNEETIRKLQVLRAALSGKAAKTLDALLESVEAHRGEWGRGESRGGAAAEALNKIQAVAAEAEGGCGCAYNFQTTVALMPAAKRPAAGEQKK